MARQSFPQSALAHAQEAQSHRHVHGRDEQGQRRERDAEGAEPVEGPKRLLRMRDVAYQLSMSEAWLYKLVAEGRFPPPVKIGQASRYRQSDVDAWVAALPSEAV